VFSYYRMCSLTIECVLLLWHSNALRRNTSLQSLLLTLYYLLFNTSSLLLTLYYLLFTTDSLLLTLYFDSNALIRNTTLQSLRVASNGLTDLSIGASGNPFLKKKKKKIWRKKKEKLLLEKYVYMPNGFSDVHGHVH